MGGLGRRCIRLVSLWIVAALVILAACGSQEPTAPPATAISPTATPSPTLQTTPSAISTPTFSPPLAPTAVSSSASPVLQLAGLILEVSTPPEDSMVSSEFVTVAGLTSPDATVSVNGILALPDTQGRFSVDLPLSLADNPLPIEVIATSISGEQRSVVRTIIFVP